MFRTLTLAAALCTTILLQMPVSPAMACISIPGDLRLISRAIDAPATSTSNRAELRRLRDVMLANRSAAPKQVAQYQAASRRALDLIGETTVVPHDAAAQPANATKSVFLRC